MAVWQVSFNVTADGVPESGWKDWWGYEGLSARFSAILGRADSWHADLERWGKDGGHQVDWWTKEADTILIRIDLRDDYYDFAGMLATLLAEYGLKMVRDDSLVEPDSDTLLTLIQESRALRFVKDPIGFIRALSQNAE